MRPGFRKIGHFPSFEGEGLSPMADCGFSPGGWELGVPVGEGVDPGELFFAGFMV